MELTPFQRASLLLGSMIIKIFIFIIFTVVYGVVFYLIWSHVLLSFGLPMISYWEAWGAGLVSLALNFLTIFFIRWLREAKK